MKKILTLMFVALMTTALSSCFCHRGMYHDGPEHGQRHSHFDDGGRPGDRGPGGHGPMAEF